MSDDHDAKTPPRTPSSALQRLKLQEDAKRRMYEIARELCERSTRGSMPIEKLRELGDELRRLVDAL